MDISAYVDSLSWEWRACISLAVASMLGALVGLEREYHGRSAGFRTQMLVALGAALAMVVSIHFGEVYGHLGGNSSIRVDPARVAYGVMAGIGFLGAGAIVRYGFNIRGMTTAASLWCTAALGLACGFGMYVVAMFATILVLIALLVLSRLDRLISARWYKSITLTVRYTGRDNIEHFRKLLHDNRIQVIDVTYTRDTVAAVETMTFNVWSSAHSQVNQMSLFESQPDVMKISIR